MLLRSKLVDHGSVFILTIGLHNMLHHHRPHMNTGTKVLAKYQMVIRKSNTFVPELHPVPKSKFTERANVFSLAQDNHLGDAAI